MTALAAAVVTVGLGTLIYIAVQAHLDVLDNNEWGP